MLNQVLTKQSEKSIQSASCYSAADSITERRTAYEDTFPDGGRGWVVVLGCLIFIIATNGWGWSVQAWGVLQEYLQVHIFPDASASVLTTLGSISGLLMALGGVIAGKLADKYGYKPFLAAGSLLWVATMVSAAFCTQIWQFLITLGIMQGISLALIFTPIVALPSQWFLRRRAFAAGIVVAGTPIGGAVTSLVLRALLSAVGLRKSFAVFAAIHAVSLAAAYCMVEERRPASLRPKDIVWYDRSFFKDPVFWSTGLCFFFVMFGFMNPMFFLPLFTAEVVPHLSPLMIALPITIFSLSAALGRILIGFIADKVGPVNSLYVAVTISGLTQLLIWMFVRTYGGIMAFSALFGFFSGGVFSLVAAVAAQLYGVDRLAGLSGLLLLFNAPGNGAGPPISGSILRATGNNWQIVIGYSGATQVIGGLCLLYARFKRQPKLIAAY